MHPSRLVALSFVPVSVLLLVRATVAGGPQPTAGSTLQVVGGLVLLPASLYSLVRPEEHPIVTDYDLWTCLLVVGTGLWTVGLVTFARRDQPSRREWARLPARRPDVRNL